MLQHRKMFLWALLLAVSLPVASSSSSRLVGVTAAFHPLQSLAGRGRCGSNTCSTGPSSAIQPHSGLDDTTRNDPPPSPGLQQRMHGLLTGSIDSPSPSSDSSSGSYYSSSTSRRTVVSQGILRASMLLVGIASTATTTTCGVPAAASAKPDCYTDCYQNCQAVAPKDLDYCRDSCLEYCQQPDRQDGLSGSVSAAKGETGILGGSFGQGTVPKGQDRPPSLIQIPGLDFSSAAGRKLIGY